MTHYDDIYELAADNYGLITSVEAKTLGASDKEMSRLARDGKSTWKNIYRIKRYASSPNNPYAIFVDAINLFEAIELKKSRT